MNLTNMNRASYQSRRNEVATYFDDTAMEAWKRLTSDAPVSRIRATVRAGRMETQSTLLSWLPDDLQGSRILDAGCGTGLMAIELASRGADVLAIDLSPKLVELAQQRVQQQSEQPGQIRFISGDMLSTKHGQFNHVVAMDSLIHYETQDMQNAIETLAGSTTSSVLFTFAPRTPLLTVMHKAGKLFPKKDRSPAIVPIGCAHLHRQLTNSQALSHWQPGRDKRIDTAFYKSHAQELVCR